MNTYIKALKLLWANCRRSSLSILRQGLVSGGYLRVSDIDHHLTVVLPEAPDGMLDYGLLLSTGDAPAAHAAATGQPEEDFPVDPEIGPNPIEVPPDLLRGITPVVGACSDDKTRACLMYVNINAPGGWAEATDGYRIFRQKLSAPAPISFLVDRLTLKIVDALPAPMECLVSEERILIYGEGWALNVKRNIDPYPDINNAILTQGLTPAVSWGPAEYTVVKKTLTAAKPFLNPKTALVKFTDTEIITRNDGINHCKVWPLGSPVFSLPADHVVGMGAKYMLETLAFIANRPAACTATKTLIGPVVWKGDGFMALQIPLRTSKAGPQTRAQALDITRDSWTGNKL